MTELDLAAAIAAGAAPSPSRCAGFDLVALRISGSGIAERPALDEIVFRDPGIWTSPAMLDRVAGLPAIAMHPAKGILDGAEFERRIVGSVMLPYVANADGIAREDGTQLWAIARIFDTAIVDAIKAGGVSTSPAVAFNKSDGNQTYRLEDGTRLLRENVPSLIDHIALLPAGQAGVWDDGQPGSGVRVDSMETTMSDTTDPVADPKDGEKLDKILAACDSLVAGHADHGKRLDKLCERMDAMEAGATGPKIEQPAQTPPKPEAIPAASTEHGRRTEAMYGRRGDAMPGDEMLPVGDAAARRDAERKEEAERASAQFRADGVARLFGETAPPPMSGERTLPYRARLLSRFQRHSKEFANVDLRTIRDDAVFGGIEQRIYADAMEAAKRGPDALPAQGFREVAKVDPYSGVRTIEFYGPQTIFETLSPPRRAVTAFRVPQYEGGRPL